MVGWLHQHQRVGIARQQPQRGGADRGASVARHRLEQDRLRLDADLAELLVDQEAMVLVADQQRCAKADVAQIARRRLLQQRALGDQRQQLLGIGCTRQRPQACARAAGQDHGMDLRRALLLKLRQCSVGKCVHGREAMGAPIERPVIKVCFATAP